MQVVAGQDLRWRDRAQYLLRSHGETLRRESGRAVDGSGAPDWPTLLQGRWGFARAFETSLRIPNKPKHCDAGVLRTLPCRPVTFCDVILAKYRLRRVYTVTHSYLLCTPGITFQGR